MQAINTKSSARILLDYLKSISNTTSFRWNWNKNFKFKKFYFFPISSNFLGSQTEDNQPTQQA